MQLTNEQEKRYTKKLIESRLRILCKYGFYGTLLMHMDFVLDQSIKSVSSDSKTLYFNPIFLDSLTKEELDLAMIHEVLHLSLRHNSRRKDFENKRYYDLAADIVANSNLLKSLSKNSYDDYLDENNIKFQGEVLPHKTPLNKEGYRFSLEQVYRYLMEDALKRCDLDDYEEDDEDEDSNDNLKNNRFDDHQKWNEDIDELGDAQWQSYVLDAVETMMVRESSNRRGTIPEFALRMFKELKQAKTNWRVLLNNFIQEEVNDYSFTPPDRRFDDNPFYLPDFNDPDEKVKDVLFMIDTSGSMSDDEITACYSEVKGAIDQFGGKLEGWLGFFDAAIVEPRRFVDEEDLEIIRPFGGGGTSFIVIFEYIRDHMKDKNISSVVILTDGYAPWPKESAAMGIPTIWLINNEESTPPWGKVARIKENINDSFN